MAFRKLAERTATALGYCLTEQVDIEKVRSLIRSLHPQDCGRNLIRIGGRHDGGYLVPDDLEGIRYCFSPGVNVTADFENQLATLNIHSFMADYSVNGPPVARAEFVFDKKYLGVIDHDPFMTLQSWVDKYLPGGDGDLLLQMDIEGDEYAVLLSTAPELLRRFRIIVLECHDLEGLLVPSAYRLYRACFEKLLQQFVVVHAHPNNCSRSVRYGDLEIPSVMEFTFYNRARVARQVPQRRFPHPLDTDNAVHMPALPLPKCWYE